MHGIRATKMSSRLCRSSMHVLTKQSWIPTRVGVGMGNGTGADIV